jgi:hypothetical protein
MYQIDDKENTKAGTGIQTVVPESWMSEGMMGETSNT